LTALALTVGCRASSPAPDRPAGDGHVVSVRQSFPFTVTDDAGRRITLSGPPARIVSLAPSNTEILYALGLGDRIMAVDQQSDYPAEVSRKPRIGGYAVPDLEQVVAATPDLVLAVGAHLDKAVPAFEAHHLTTLVLDPKDLDGMLHDLTLVGQAAGQSARAADLVSTLQRRIASVASRVRGAQPPTVYYELDPLLYTAGPGSFLNDLIVRAGGVNIAADTGRPWPKISAERILLRNPDVILLGDMAAGESAERIRRRPGWQSLRAVQQNRIVSISADLTTRPGPRVVDGLEAIARALHPDRFPK
jgi:iron complex transport system substrate-binding protein